MSSRTLGTAGGLILATAGLLLACGESGPPPASLEASPEPSPEPVAPAPPSLEERLRRAIREHDPAGLARLLDEVEDLEAKSADGRTLMHEVARGGRREVAQVLLAAGADIDAVDGNGQRPIHLLAHRLGRSRRSQPDLLELFLERGVDLGFEGSAAVVELARDSSDEVLALLIVEGGVTPVGLPLELAARLVEDEQFTLLRQIIRPTDPGAALCRAATPRLADVALALLASGSDPNGRCELGGSNYLPLTAALKGLTGEDPWATQRRLVVRGLLEGGADPNLADAQDRLPLRSAAAGPDAELTQLLLEFGATEPELGLPSAAERGRLEQVRLLLASGADPKAPRSSLALARAVVKGHVEIERALTAAGVDLSGGPQLLTRLLGHCEENERIAARLLDLGTDPDHLDAYGELPLIAVQRCPRVFQLLLARGANPATVDGDGDAAIHRVGGRVFIDAYLEAGGSLEARDAEGRTALIRALDERSIPVELLLELGADIEARDDSGRTPLLAAAGNPGGLFYNNTDVFTLIEAGARLDVKDTEGLGASDHFRRGVLPKLQTAELTMALVGGDLVFTAQAPSEYGFAFSQRDLPTNYGAGDVHAVLEFAPLDGPAPGPLFGRTREGDIFQFHAIVSLGEHHVLVKIRGPERFAQEMEWTLRLVADSMRPGKRIGTGEAPRTRIGSQRTLREGAGHLLQSQPEPSSNPA